MLIWSNRGQALGGDVRILIGVLAVVNMVISIPTQQTEGRLGDYTRIVFDSILSLCVVFLSTSATSSLVWVALFVPVIEAAAIAPIAAVAIWVAVSLLYTSLRVIMPGATDTSFVAGIQQLLTVGIVGIPLARWSHRTSRSLRMAAVEKRSAGQYAFSLRQVGEYVSRLTEVRTTEEVDAIVLAARRALGSDRGEILARDDSGQWRLLQATGVAVGRTTWALLDGALDSGRPVVAHELDAVHAVQLAGFRTAAAVNLGEKRSAVWRLWFQTRDLGRHDFEALDLLTSAVRQAYRTVAEIERLKSWSEELERRANIDQLTGLLNRRGLDRSIEERYTDQDYIAALYLDLNHFKPINDKYGHESGDHVLQIVARRFQACLPSGALLARVGGDEFAIIVDVAKLGGSELSPVVSATDAVINHNPKQIGGESSERQAALSELRDRLEMSLDEPIAYKERRLRVSVSVGIGQGEPVTGLEELLRLADIDMYERKRALARVSEASSPSDELLT